VVAKILDGTSEASGKGLTDGRDGARLQRAMARDGVDVRLSLWEGMWHVFQAHNVPEARDAQNEVAAFLLGQLDR